MPLRMMAGASAPGSGGMVDGVRIGPPPDMPSLLLNNRIVYLGMPINAAVTELIIGELLYLQYDSSVKPCLMYINSPGTTTEDVTVTALGEASAWYGTFEMAVTLDRTGGRLASEQIFARDIGPVVLTLDGFRWELASYE